MHRWRAFPRAVIVIVLAALAARPPALEARGEEGGSQAGSPETILWDTGVPLPDPLPPAAFAAKTGWSLVPEDNTTHTFLGDAVLANDKLAVVLRAKGAGAEVYAQAEAGLKRRASLVPLPAAAGAAAGLASVRIVQNTPAAVGLEASYRTADGNSLSVAYRLATGQMTVEVRPGQRTRRLAIRSDAQYVVVPDFFGDDMLFDARSLRRPRLGLPAENFFLGLLDEGSAMLMCVWQSSRQGAEATCSGTGPQARIGGCEIECLQGKAIWVALLEGTNLWHQRAISAEEMSKDLILAWKPPFAARWRGDFLDAGGATRSWYFSAANEPGEEAPTAGPRECPCWLEGQRAVVRGGLAGAPAGTAGEAARQLVVYAIDRSRATPLTVFCPMDVLRNTLGVGPCQYILQTEGLAGETNPTPDEVTNWVEKQFRAKKEKRAAGEMREQLAGMVEHVGRTQARIHQYAALARRLDALLASQSNSAQLGEAVRGLRPVVDRLKQAAGDGSEGAKPAQQAAKLADEILALVGSPNALAECRRLGAELRRLGAAQERALANSRMAVRWLRQQARMTAADDPPSAPLAAAVRAEAERVLQAK